MERELWQRIVTTLKRLPRRSPTGAVYCNYEIIAVLLWAALHDRPISWACRRPSWPPQAWRRRLPDQSTMSRRLRDPAIIEDLRRLVQIIQRDIHEDIDLLMIDAKALKVPEHSSDSDAKTGYGAGGYGRGYKMHVIIDAAWRVVAWEVEPMNKAESVVARELVKQADEEGVLPKPSVMLGDAAFDSNDLYAEASDAEIQLVAPRRKPFRSISKWHRQHPNRKRAINLLEGDRTLNRHIRVARAHIERFFGALASVGGGLMNLPAWARRTWRVRTWVAAKLGIFVARNTLNRIANA